MRIISLNAWGGRALHPLMRFFERWSDKPDIFCLQEVHNGDTAELRRRHPREFVEGNLFRLIGSELPDFRGFHATFPDDPHRMSLAMFIRSGILIRDFGHVPVHEPKQRQEMGSVILSPRRLQYVTVRENGRWLLVANYHGLWTPDGKRDSPERLEQSISVKGTLEQFGMAQVLTGDFNLEPDTKSLRILEYGMSNLVKRMGVDSTRTVLYREYDKPDFSMYADYMLTTPDVHVDEFRVLPDICSDHAALYLDCTVGIDEKEENE